MLPRFALASWITLSASLVAAGALVRYDGTYFVSDQFILGLLFFVAGLMLTIALICWIPLLRLLPDDLRPGRFVSAVLIAPASTMLLLVGMSYEPGESSAARHREHLLRVARIVVDDYDRRGRMPPFFEDALRRSADGLPHRGDADGRALIYRRLDPSHAILCAPECRVHVAISGGRIDYRPWPPGEPDPCQSGSPSSYFAGASTTGAERIDPDH